MTGAVRGNRLVSRTPGPFPGCISTVTSPINDRDNRGRLPSWSLYLRSRAKVTSTPSGWLGRSSNLIAETSPIRMPLLRTGTPSSTPGASAKCTVR